MSRYIFCFFIVVNYLVAHGQQSDSLNTDRIKYRFGFLIATNWTAEKTTPPGGRLGFSIGTTMECRLTKKVFLFLQPTLSFLTYKNGPQTIEATNIEIPLHILFKPFDSKFRPTVSLGPNYKTSLSTSSYGQWFADITLGVERQLKHFAIAPELRYSYGQSIQTVYFVIHFKG